MNSIIDLLDLEDSEIIIKDIQIHGQTKTLFLETPPIVHFCPICGYRMHSRGVKSRKIKHPKYLISDTYNQYIDYVDKYFPNAVPVVDSFHVIQWIIRMIDNHIRQLLKYYRQRDRERQEQLSLEEGRPISLPISDEVYLLKKYRWLILANQDNIHYHSEPRVDQHFHVLMNTYDYEDAIFHIDNKLKDYRELKEMYVRFNSINAGTPTAAREELIAFYANSEHSMFRAFEHFRNRFLYAARTTPILNGVTDYNPVTYFEDE